MTPTTVKPNGPPGGFKWRRLPSLVWLPLFVLLSFHTAAASDAPYGATLTAVDGAVTIWDPSAAAWQPVAVNLPLSAENRLHVPKDASADILFDDGSIVTLQGEAEIELRELSVDTGSGKILASLYMKAGRLLANVAALFHRESRFTVQTPTAVAGVRGTQFVVEATADEGTDIGVFEGRVAVEGVDPAGRADAGSRVVLEKGYQTRVRRLKRPGAPFALNARMQRHRGNLDRLAKRAKINRVNLNKIRRERIRVQQKMIERWRKRSSKVSIPAGSGSRPGKPAATTFKGQGQSKPKVNRRRPHKK